jgi:hypothetical protein
MDEGTGTNIWCWECGHYARADRCPTGCRTGLHGYCDKSRNAEHKVEMQAQGNVARDEAIRRVDDHADETLKAALLDSAHVVARRQPSVFCDDIWFEYETRNLPHPREPRVLGATVKAAAKEGWIAPTDEYRQSIRPSTHRAPKRVWRSLIYTGDR